MRPWGPALAASLAGVVAACDGGPAAENLEPSSPRLHLVASYVDSAGLRLDLIASLVPGITEDGRVREVLNPVLGVGETRLQPTGRGGQPGELLYDTSLPVLGMLHETPLTIDPPVVAGLSPTYGPVRWYIHGRAGPDTLSVQRGEDLVLDLEPPIGVSSPPPETGYLRLELGDGTNVTVVMTSLEPVDPIVVPSELLPEAPGGTIVATLVMGRFRDHEPVEEPYRMVPSIEARIVWFVRMVP